MLKDAFGWTHSETEEVIAMASGEDDYRSRIIGAEIYIQLFIGGRTTEQMSESLLSQRGA